MLPDIPTDPPVPCKIDRRSSPLLRCRHGSARARFSPEYCSRINAL